jgi:hypothetical protein
MGLSAVFTSTVAHTIGTDTVAITDAAASTAAVSHAEVTPNGCRLVPTLVQVVVLRLPGSNVSAVETITPVAFWSGCASSHALIAAMSLALVYVFITEALTG